MKAGPSVHLQAVWSLGGNLGTKGLLSSFLLVQKRAVRLQVLLPSSPRQTETPSSCWDLRKTHVHKRGKDHS